MRRKASEIPSRELNIGGISVTLEYRKVKNINLYIKPPDGRVLVTAPPLHSATPQPAYEPAPQPMRPATGVSEPDVWGGSSGSNDPFSMANVPSILRNK